MLFKVPKNDMEPKAPTHLAPILPADHIQRGIFRLKELTSPPDSHDQSQNEGSIVLLIAILSFLLTRQILPLKNVTIKG